MKFKDIFNDEILMNDYNEIEFKIMSIYNDLNDKFNKKGVLKEYSIFYKYFYYTFDKYKVIVCYSYKEEIFYILLAGINKKINDTIKEKLNIHSDERYFWKKEFDIGNFDEIKMIIENILNKGSMYEIKS